MGKIIAAINMTLDGNCDHTAVSPDAEIHQHYKSLLEQGDAILYGRKTFQLMQFWQDLLNNPSGEKSMVEFAAAIDRIPKIVFSNTLQSTGWGTASLSDLSLEQAAVQLKQQPDKTIYVGSRSLINQLLRLQLVDELQICIHPVIAGRGLQLFDEDINRSELRLIKTKAFESGPVILYYEPAKTNSLLNVTS